MTRFALTVGILAFVFLGEVYFSCLLTTVSLSVMMPNLS